MAFWIEPVALVSAVVAFYVVMWIRWGRDPKPGTIVTQYKPPGDLSPALLRYIWKQKFDERVVWAGLLSLVSRGLAVLEKREHATYIKPVWPPKKKPLLPKEEFVLYDDLATVRGRKGIRLSLLDDWMGHMAVRMADVVRSSQQGRWFLENRSVVLAGAVLSAVGVMIVASPASVDQLLVLVIPAPLMAVGAFYGYFLAQRIVELSRVARDHPGLPIVRRLVAMLLLAIPYSAAIFVGAVVLYFSFGGLLLAVMVVLTVVNLIFMYLMKAPTARARKLLDEIEGFRHFLAMVEHLPMDLPDAPNIRPGLYEKYLPYALALEVEQQWCDQVAAIASSDHEVSEVGPAHVFHLGMWNGSPVQIAYRPEEQGRRW